MEQVSKASWDGTSLKIVTTGQMGDQTRVVSLEGGKLTMSNTAPGRDKPGATIVEVTYEADGKTRTMGYYTVPPDAMESSALMRPWAELAWGAALRAAAGKNKPKASVKKPAAKKMPARKA